jgi:glycosyltransferase involved in cell wall biosynthesis
VAIGIDRTLARRRVNETRRPTAVYLTRNLAVGGAERVYLNYVHHARTVAPVVALLERRGGLVAELDPNIPWNARREPPEGATAEEIPGETFARLASECRWLRKVVRAADADVVSSFLMRAHIVALLTKILLMPRLPVVLNVHEHMSESEKYLYPYSRDRKMMRWITRHLFPRANRIVVVANEVKRDLVETFGVSEHLIEVVYNPLDADRIRAGARAPLDDRWKSRAGQLTVVAVGRLVQLKGYDLLIRAIAELRKKLDVRLILVGDGDQRARLIDLTRALNIEDHVMFAGQQDNPWRFMAAGDALALTSHTEAFPCVLAEAMLLGVPVLAAECSRGIYEMLEDGRSGVIVPVNDVGAIARGLDRLLGDVQLRGQLVAAGKKRVEAFDMATVEQRYESILTGVIAPRAT